MERTHTLREEIASALTHGVGAVAALAGGAVLITLAALFGTPSQIVGASIFGFSLLLLYVASTLYHAIPAERAKARLKVFDHCAIFVLIAGTYTPFTLVGLRGAWGWSLLAVIWTLAVLGVIFKLYCTGRFKLLSTAMYIAMGWLVIVAIVPLARALPADALAWLIVGGVSYTAGTYFYHHPRLKYAHAIWHLFVIGGSVCHFAAVVSQVVPGAADCVA